MPLPEVMWTKRQFILLIPLSSSDYILCSFLQLHRGWAWMPPVFWLSLAQPALQWALPCRGVLAILQEESFFWPLSHFLQAITLKTLWETKAQWKPLMYFTRSLSRRIIKWLSCPTAPLPTVRSPILPAAGSGESTSRWGLPTGKILMLQGQYC